MSSSHLILCHPLLTSAFNLSQHQGLFQWVLHIRWPKYWSFSFSISPSNDYSGLISFRMDWLDLLAVQGTLKGLLQHHSSEVSILWHSAFCIHFIYFLLCFICMMMCLMYCALYRWCFIHHTASIHHTLVWDSLLLDLLGSEAPSPSSEPSKRHPWPSPSQGVKPPGTE